MSGHPLSHLDAAGDGYLFKKQLLQKNLKKQLLPAKVGHRKKSENPIKLSLHPSLKCLKHPETIVHFPIQAKIAPSCRRLRLRSPEKKACTKLLEINFIRGSSEKKKNGHGAGGQTKPTSGVPPPPRPAPRHGGLENSAAERQLCVQRVRLKKWEQVVLSKEMLMAKKSTGRIVRPPESLEKRSSVQEPVALNQKAVQKSSEKAFLVNNGSKSSEGPNCTPFLWARFDLRRGRAWPWQLSAATSEVWISTPMFCQIMFKEYVVLIFTVYFSY